MIINDMIQEETYYENEWKEINSTVGTAVLAMGILAGCGSSTTGDNRSRDNRPGHRRRDRCRVFCCVRRHKKTQKQQRQRMPRPLI